MRNFIIIISFVLLIFKVGVAGAKTQIADGPSIILQPDTNTIKLNDTIIIDATNLEKIKTFLIDSTNYKKEFESINGDISYLKLQSENDKNSLTWAKFLLYPIIALVLALLIFIIIDKKKRRDEILYVLTGNRKKRKHRLSEWENDLIAKAAERIAHSDDHFFKSTISKFEQTVKELQGRIEIIEDVDRNKPNVVSDHIEKQPEVVILDPSSKTLYADAILNGMFNKITEQPNDDTVYELLLKTTSDKNAVLTIYRDAYRRVIETPDFIEGCEKQRINNTPNDLQIEKGKAQLQDNGKWKIIKKAIVKFV